MGTTKMRQNETWREAPVSELKATVARFEQRIRDAQVASGPTRDTVRRAIRRNGDGRCPAWLKRLSMDVVVKYGDDLADLFCEHPDDVVRLAPYEMWIGHQPADRADRIDPVEVLTKDAEWTDEWGTRWGHSSGGTGAYQLRPAIADWSELDDYLATRLPRADAPGRFDPVKKELELFRGSKYLLGRIHLLLYERLNCLRGPQNVLLDLYTNEGELRRLCDAIAGYDREMIRRWAALGADGLFLTEDWGAQNGLMISPECGGGSSSPTTPP